MNVQEKILEELNKATAIIIDNDEIVYHNVNYIDDDIVIEWNSVAYGNRVEVSREQFAIDSSIDDNGNITVIGNFIVDDDVEENVAYTITPLYTKNTLHKPTVIDDDKVKCVWKGLDEEDKEYTVEVTPDWYEDNGTPIDMQGNDMTYVKTYIE